LQRLSEGELIALFLAERVMQHYKNTPYAKDLATAFQKLSLALPEEVTINLNHLMDALSFRPSAERAADVRCFKALTKAVRERRQLELLYWTASRDESGRRVVDPYHLTSTDGEWYLAAYCHLREEVRLFVPSRIKEYRETGISFDVPASFRIDTYLDHTFRIMHGDGKPRRIKVRFTGSATRYVSEKTWHPSQQVEKKKDGSLILTLALDHFLEVKRWVLAYGPDCEVLEPAELRDQVCQELRKAARQ
jgi:predicted DNA-binding transcriptional regulator YafY